MMSTYLLFQIFVPPGQWSSSPMQPLPQPGQGYKQTNKQTNKHTNKKTNNIINQQTNKQTNKPTKKQPGQHVLEKPSAKYL